MSPYEIAYAGGSVEHWNDEPGAVWIKRLLQSYPKAVWLNPEPEARWDYTPSVKLTRELMEDRMFPLTLSGLDQGSRHCTECDGGRQSYSTLLRPACRLVRQDRQHFC